MTQSRTTALIADDEPLLRTSLKRLLREAWPELEVIAEARNGREAVEMFEALRPDICFLDVHMPGLSGVEAARFIGKRAQLVFVTAFDQYAVQAFDSGALDYLVKPVEPARLADTVARLQERLGAGQLPDADKLIEQLAARLRKSAEPAALRWIRASVGQTVRVIAVEEIDYLRSDSKYTRIAWRGDEGKPAEALVRTPLKELLTQLDAAQFAQVHRAVVVNLSAISHILRGDNETASIHLRGRDDVLPVSRNYLHLFKQM
ncbi:LytR/AlgR family response regulator transcription factor [Dokdonella sp.]|uniref:LytR/AlgR family response regulator transcription factor n=1 Tax=Dokdonella sp. TaxID=2291710 RepID=UPI003C4D585A